MREVGEERLDAEPWVGRTCHGKFSRGIGSAADENLCAGHRAVWRWEVVVVETEMGLAQEFLAAAGSTMSFTKDGGTRDEVQDEEVVLGSGSGGDVEELWCEVVSEGSVWTAGKFVAVCGGVGHDGGGAEDEGVVSKPSMIECDEDGFGIALGDNGIEKSEEKVVNAGDEGCGRAVGKGADGERGGAFVYTERGEEVSVLVGVDALGDCEDPVVSRSG